MKTRAAFALPWILAVSGILPAADSGSGGPSTAEDPVPDYYTWEIDNGITGAGADVDSDGDVISNGIEFVIGGDPFGPGSDSNSLLPVITVDAVYLNFTFRRTNASAKYDPFVEYSSDLAEWIMADPGENGVLIEEDVGAEVAIVTVSIPRDLATGSKFFARLRVNISPPIDP